MVKFLFIILLAWSFCYSTNDVYTYVKTTKGTFVSLNAYNASKGDSVVSLQIGKNWTVSGKNTVPSTIDFAMFVGEGKIYGSTGSAVDTLVISRMSAQPMRQIFDTSITILFAPGAVSEVRPEWWGAKGDSLTDDTRAIQNAINSITGGTVKLSKGKYRVTTRIFLKSNVSIIGDNKQSIIIVSPTTATRTILRGDSVSDIKIDGIKIKGDGYWTATPFTNPRSAGNSVGFTNDNFGIYLGDDSVSNIEISNCDFNGIGAGVWITKGADIKIHSNSASNCGEAAIEIYTCKNSEIYSNTISGIYGNMTDAGVTDTNSSKFADGIYMSDCNRSNVHHNDISNVRRIGIVLEGSAPIKNERTIVDANIIHNIYGDRGTEYNAGIWCEINHVDTSTLISNNIVDTSKYGIVANNCRINGGSIRHCTSYGIDPNGINVHISNVTLEDNQVGVATPDVADSTAVFTVDNCVFLRNRSIGFQLSNCKGFYTIKNCFFMDNGIGTSYSSAAILIDQYFTGQKVAINNNTFVSSANQGDTVGQLYAIRAIDSNAGITGGDFNYTTDFIKNNDFIYKGTFSSVYPANMDVTPCAFGNGNYGNGTATITEFCGEQGNVSSKMPIPSLHQRQTVGRQRFLGYRSSKPTTGTFRTGDFYLNNNILSTTGTQFVCASGGTPGTWQERGFGNLYPQPNYLSYEKTYSVSSNDSVVVMDINGASLNPNNSYKVMGYVTYTSQLNGATWVLRGNGTTFTLSNIYLTDTTLNQPKLYLCPTSDTVKLKLYNTATVYTAALSITEINNAPGLPWVDMNFRTNGNSITTSKKLSTTDTTSSTSSTTGALVVAGGASIGARSRFLGDSLILGSGASKVTLDTVAGLTLTGNAKVWDDLRITPGSFDRPGTSDPALVAYGSTFLWEFAVDDSATFTIQLPHSYSSEDSVYAHVHWTPGTRGNEEGTALVGWKIGYSWASIDSVFPAFAVVDLSDACKSTDGQYLMSPEVGIAGSGKMKSSMLICNIKRTDGGAEDTWVGTASGQLPFLLEVDFHYPISTLGTPTR